MSAHLVRLVAHLRWADERVLAALRGATSAPPRALELYAHVVGAEHVWVARLHDEAPRLPPWPTLSLHAAAALAEETHAALAQLAAGLDAAGAARLVSYRNSAGTAFQSTVEEILLQVALHGAYHRGQVALLLREAGADPVPTDFILFTREGGAR